HGGDRARLQSVLLDQRPFGFGVGGKGVDGDYRRHAQFANVLYLHHQIRAALFERAQVLLDDATVEGLTCYHLEAARVHLERAHGRHHHRHVGYETADPELDVAELLEAHISPEPGLCYEEVGAFNADVVGQD